MFGIKQQMRVRPSIAEIDVHKVNYWNISKTIFPYLVGMLKQGCQLKQSIMHMQVQKLQ